MQIKVFTYHFIFKHIIYLILIGQLWTNLGTFCHWVTDSEIELIELNSSEDNESEKENDKKDQDDKNRARLTHLHSNLELLVHSNFRFNNFNSQHHPEINTPPPKSYLVFTS